MSRSSQRAVLALAAFLAACGDRSPESGATISVAVTQRATASRTTAGGSSVPDAFAHRDRYPSCGEDHSLALDPMGPASPIRQCFFDANAKGGSAELTSHEASASYVYRTNPDRTIEVFVVGAGPDGPWETFRCAGLVPDERRVFELAGCADPIELE